MGVFGFWQWLLVGVLVLLLFGGKGKISGLMGDVGKGLKSFKKGMADDAVNKPSVPGDDAKVINNNGDEAVDASVQDKDKNKDQDQDKAASG